jgi:hypothetical protein
MDIMTSMILQGEPRTTGNTEHRALAGHRFGHVESIDTNEVY